MQQMAEGLFSQMGDFGSLMRDNDMSPFERGFGTAAEARLLPSSKLTFLVDSFQTSTPDPDGFLTRDTRCFMVTDAGGGKRSLGLHLGFLLENIEFESSQSMAWNEPPHALQDSLFNAIVSACNKPGGPGAAMLSWVVGGPCRPQRVLFVAKSHERLLRKRLKKKLGIVETGVAPPSLVEESRKILANAVLGGS